MELLQYAMQQRISGLGWTKVEVIDENQGRSATTISGRTGFQRMVAEVCLGKVGAVAAIEVSRFARNNRDWHQLLEMCGMVNTLLPSISRRWSRPSKERIDGLLRPFDKAADLLETIPGIGRTSSIAAIESDAHATTPLDSHALASTSRSGQLRSADPDGRVAVTSTRRALNDPSPHACPYRTGVLPSPAPPTSASMTAPMELPKAVPATPQETATMLATQRVVEQQRQRHLHSVTSKCA